MTTIKRMSEDNVYLNGQIVPAEDAKISVSDAGLLHGASTFTTMLAHNGLVFRFDRHLQRLMDTVDLLGLRTDATPEQLQAATYDLLRANGLAEARLRITLTPGGVRDDQPTTIITAEALPDYPASWYEKGITVIVTSFKQSPGEIVYGYKTGCYLPRILARREAAAAGAEEALWYTTGSYLAEACLNNVFLVLKGRVHTPSTETPVLPGVVRDTVLELCESMDIPHDAKTPLTVTEMLAAEEIFLTGSCSGIRPVIKVERHDIGDGRPGELTRRIMAAYRELLDAECAGPGQQDTSTDS